MSAALRAGGPVFERPAAVCCDRSTAAEATAATGLTGTVVDAPARASC